MIYQCSACGELSPELLRPDAGYCGATYLGHKWGPLELEAVMREVIRRLDGLTREVDKLDYRTREVDE